MRVRTSVLSVRPLRWPAAIAVAAVVVLAAWPIVSVDPDASLDGSWRASLQFAADARLAFGRDYLFTYGPLGFLDAPQLYVPALGLLACVFLLLAELALAFFLLRRLTPVLPLGVALLATYCVAVLRPEPADVALLALFAACVAALVDGNQGRTLVRFAVVAGAVAGVELFVKTNDGALAVVFVAVTLAALARDVRPVAAGVAAFAIASLAAWFGTGQSLGGVGPYAHGTYEIVAGYTAAMAREQAGRRWEYAAAAVIALAVAALAWRAAGGLARRARAGLLLVVLVLGFAAFKEGFVRHDGHSLSFFFALAVAAGALAGPGRARVLAVATLAVAFGCAVVAGRPTLVALVDPVASLHRAGSQAALLVDGSRRQRRLDADRQEAVRDLDLDAPALKRLVGSRSVAVEPFDIAAAWALRLHWRGAPVPQAYSAYTPYLDDLNARFLLGPDAPERMLRQPDDVLIDDHGISTEAPASWLAILCRYRQLAVRGSWQVLARERDRCGPERPLGSASATHGSFVRVPAARPGDLVVARFTLPSTGSPLRQLLYKPAGFPVVAFRQGDGTSSFRIAPANAGQPVVVRVPRTAGYAEGFGAELRADAVAIRDLPGRYSVRFFAIPLTR